VISVAGQPRAEDSIPPAFWYRRRLLGPTRGRVFSALAWPGIGCSRRLLAALLLLSVALLSACSGPWLSWIATPTPSAPPTMATATPTATATLPSPTPTSTATATPSATPTITPSPTATPLPLTMRVSLGSSQVQQGRAFVVTAIANQPCVVLGQIEERQIQFVSRDGMTHIAFVGVRALAALDEQALSVIATTADGRGLTLDTSISVVSGNHERETIPLTPSLSALLDPAITEPELLRVAEVYARFTPAVSWQGAFDWPLQGPITSYFGTQRWYGNVLQSYHGGIDIDGETGDEVRAPAGGVVALADALKVRGNAVIIDHGAGILSGYYHLEQLDVEEGQVIERGTRLGTVGSTGLSTGSHLHWELRVSGVAVDAAQWTQMALLPENPGDHKEVP
jgi:murein DD-endopeptidase MepM/ murein hydrolase activator NlpD